MCADNRLSNGTVIYWNWISAAGKCWQWRTASTEEFGQTGHGKLVIQNCCLRCHCPFLSNNSRYTVVIWAVLVMLDVW